ncbi:iron dicitrate transport regulator FecR [Paraburkholderia sp. JPY303]|uniref:FecR family protein n=1 Tax=Paraburkholderia atlantica TaxID=2654982 RepID=UPI001591D937|nr:FecR domain-containing protein [Paraburkholderia atlantica]NUY29988.1 iron dicitrate transport regulator FecR [Paraburkholderia atlantica]
MSTGRRRALKGLSWLAIAAPAGWLTSRLPWRTWTADVRTPTGELHDVLLADGTQITLGNASAIDAALEANVRRVHLLEGEIMVRPLSDVRGTGGTRATHPPLLVQTAAGVVEASGTQFGVQQRDGFTRVAAFRGDASVTPAAGAAQMLTQGQWCTFTRDGIAAPHTLDPREAMWTRGLLYANDMRIADLVDQLARYHAGVLRCATDVADLRVSGIYQLTDTDATLALLQRTYPIRLRSITPYWTLVEAIDSARI